MSNHMPGNAKEEITYPFPNFSGETVEVWQRISNFIPHYMIFVIHAGIKVYQRGPICLTHYIGAYMLNDLETCWRSPFLLSPAHLLFNSLARGVCGNNFKGMIFKHIEQNSSSRTQCVIALNWVPLNLTNEKSTLVQLMAWCRQATRHCPSQ